MSQAPPRPGTAEPQGSAVMGRYPPRAPARPAAPRAPDRRGAPGPAPTAHGYGAERARELAPLASRAAVAERLRLASAVAADSEAGWPLPRLDLPEIRPQVEHAGVADSVLADPDLHAVRAFLAGGEAAAADLAERETEALTDLGAALELPGDLIRHLDRILDPAGGLADGASEELSRLRARVRSLREQVRSRLDELAGSNKLRGAVQEGGGVTQRGGRYVLPIKAEHQSRVRGIVHAASGTGETVFIEPLETVAANNELEQAEEAAHREEHRIRQLATRAVGRASTEIAELVDRLGLLDLLRAGERLRNDFHGSVVPVGEGPAFELSRLRHPLLSLDHGPDTVVPADLALGGEQRCLVISGPNTGGKTVLLKAAGLVHWMAYCGLPVPAEGHLGWFEQIWAVIGDQQSLAADLSTFSAQLVRIKALLEGLDEHRLVLVDELGTGTNPGEGGALGLAVLDRLRASGCVSLVSTHLERLKHYAVAQPEVVNAAVGFDLDRLAPTYELRWEQAGRSQALEIGARLGLPEDLLADARAALDEQDQEAERLLAERDELMQQAQSDRATAESARRSMEDEARRTEQLRRELAQEQQRAYDKVYEEWRAELEAARTEVRSVIRHLKETGNTAEADKALDALDARFQAGAPAAEEPSAGGAVETAASVQEGDQGRLEPFRKTGTVVSVDAGRGTVVVDIAGKHIQGELANFRPVGGGAGREGGEAAPSPGKQAGGAGGHATKTRQPSSTRLDLRGRRRDEALAELARFLDDAYGAGFASVEILHGKGTGVLSEAVRDALAQDSRVVRFSFAAPEAGGAGVTQAAFREAD